MFESNTLFFFFCNELLLLTKVFFKHLMVSKKHSIIEDIVSDREMKKGD